MDPLSPPHAVLFDLDGTLVDSSPDLVRAVTELCAELKLPFPDTVAVRQRISAGGIAMLRTAIPNFTDAQIDVLLPRFLEIYAQGLAVETRLYPGMEALLESLESRGIGWGVVTNKSEALAQAVMTQLDLARRSGALIGGDTLAVKKPDPEPVREACRRMHVDPGAVWFVGDDLRDIEAGNAAGARTIAAAWGYLDGGDPTTWDANWVAPSVVSLHRALRET